MTNLNPDDFYSVDDYIKAVLLELNDRVGLVDLLILLAKMSQENAEYWDKYLTNHEHPAAQDFLDFWETADRKIMKVAQELDKFPFSFENS